MTANDSESLTRFLSEFRIYPQGLDPESLAQRTGLDPADLLPLRRRLEEDGFGFAEDYEGRWVLETHPNRLYGYWVQAGLRCDRLGCQVYYKDEVASTQDIAFELMVEGRPHGTLVVAEHQTGGRGRQDRAWHSTPHECLLFSLLLDLEPPETFASVLTIATATALARSIQDIAGVPARIKFPNDILVRGKKVAGVLLEVRDYGVPRRAVAGIGVNVNQLVDAFPDDLKEIATSLRMERRDQEPVRRSRLLRYTLRELEKWLERIAAGEFSDLENAWNRFSGMEGREVSFRCGNEDVEGRINVASVKDGLLVRMTGGGERQFRLEHITQFLYRDEEST